MMDKEQAKKQISELVASFQQLTSKQISQYNEETTKKNFILPLFEKLGWGVYTDEVAAEENVSGGRVDYAFKIGGVPRFYVEAKKLGSDIFDINYAKQAITYAYNKGISWAILTNFKDILVFYALAETSNPNKARLHFTSSDFVTDFEKLWLLSKEAISSELLDKEAEKLGIVPTKRPPTVEKKLFSQLRQWREALSKQLLHHDQTFNPKGQDINKSLKNIDEVIQKLFNRLIFIRTCEDRKIEAANLRGMVHTWDSQGKKEELVNKLRETFSYYNKNYDSDLFEEHMADEAYVESNTLQEILIGLYDVPGGLASYDFSVIDADVLGQVYEQYLGYTAVAYKQRAQQLQTKMDMGLLTTTIELEAKKQKRKEQGIYYTPKWVVDYIVQQTVGKLLQEKRYSEILDLKILDPSCGSGSFLIRAYDELLNYHAKVKGKSVTQLDQWDRLPVLTNNIFGVDLDQQAVEIARLNLLLRALARQAKLPILSENIKRGNSLISGDEKELEPYFGKEWESKRPFSWDKEFKAIIDKGGFDVVIGNPPYVRIQNLPREDAEFYRSKYQSAYGSFDLYVLFIERALELIKPGGYLAYITSGKFLQSEYGKKLQSLLASKTNISNIIDLSRQDVFEGASTYPLILVLNKQISKKSIHYFQVPADYALDSPEARNFSSSISVPQDSILKGSWPPPIGKTSALIDKIVQGNKVLGAVAIQIGQGLKTGADAVYVVKLLSTDGKIAEVMSGSLDKKVKLDVELLKPLVKIEHLRRYNLFSTDLRIIFPYSKSQLIEESVLKNKYELTYEYLYKNRDLLKNRVWGDVAKHVWFSFSRNQAIKLVDEPKILTPDTSLKASFCYDKVGAYAFNGGFAGGYGITYKGPENIIYLLGLLNSKLLDFFLHFKSTVFHGGYFSYESRFIKQIPIHKIDFANQGEKKIHDKIVYLVSRLVETHQKTNYVTSQQSDEYVNLIHQMNQAEAEINDLVYDLYGLTKEERALIEESYGLASH